MKYRFVKHTSSFGEVWYYSEQFINDLWVYVPDTSKDDEQEAKEIFDSLVESKTEILAEREF